MDERRNEKRRRLERARIKQMMKKRGIVRKYVKLTGQMNKSNTEVELPGNVPKKLRRE
jgi:hypothetical protein